MMKLLLTSSFALLLFTSSVAAQIRDLGANRFVLDDGTYHLYLVTSPGMTGDAFFYFPPGGGSATPGGTLEGQTLRWNNTSTMWEPSNLLINTGTRLGFNMLTPQSKFHYRDTMTAMGASHLVQTYADGTGSGSPGFYNGYFDFITEGATSFNTSAAIGLAGRVSDTRTVGNILPEALGTIGSIDHLSDGTITEARAIVGQINNFNPGVGPMNTATAVHAIAFNNNTIGDLRGVWVEGPYGTGTMSTYTGVLIDQVASASTNMALLYNHSTDPISINSDGKLTIGDVPSSFGDRLEIRSASTATTQVFGTYGSFALAPSGVTTQNSYGSFFTASAQDGGDMSGRALIGLAGDVSGDRTAGAGDVGRLIGTAGLARSPGTESNPELVGLYGEATGLSTGTIDHARAVMGRVFSGLGGTVNEAYGLYAGNASLFGGGSVLINYGVFVEEMTAGSSANYAFFYDHPTDPVVIDGDGMVGVNTAGPNVSLDVDGALALRNGGMQFLVAGAISFNMGANRSFINVTPDAGGTSTITDIQSGVDGRIAIIHSVGPAALTLQNNAGGSMQIYTGTGADIVTSGDATITLLYNSQYPAWIVLSVQD